MSLSVLKEMDGPEAVRIMRTMRGSIFESRGKSPQNPDIAISAGRAGLSKKNIDAASEI
jgi:hypothetical protein